ncbi:MAG TPA: 16S rRNA (cytosine(1402)-N(4))-methyltransferase RsmH [Gammaproteobacteria bacterium]|jgi:16S rRNA (cytosine1402-N4)-methyltransferase|nr:16S rRNA (cytosine(1402)-N(4))-methyltransferase RsmH [Gammaproteobacteria bacterium]
MNERCHTHIPVLLKETISMLITDRDGLYIDATFGRGSHAKAILEELSEAGRLIAFDKDPEAVNYANVHFIKDKRFSIFHASFAGMADCLKERDACGQVHGILFDLGVSSPQLDNPMRGFSFSREGALDMRMDTTKGQDAMRWLATVDEKALADVLWQYGEERFSRRIARAIVASRLKAPITTTTQLADIIKYAQPKTKQERHPATRSFQAIRIAINDELGDLEKGLVQAKEALVVGGRLLVISFHSLEDGIVKRFMKERDKEDALPRKLPIKKTVSKRTLKVLCNPIKPTKEEIDRNPRSRSAVLRVAEKVFSEELP